jgi:hypothetical protein
MLGEAAHETRREERVPIDGAIRFRYPDLFTGRMKDFCPGGLRAEIPVSLDVNSPIEVEIFGGRILASGHVRWVRLEEAQVHVGIQFRDGDRDMIRQVQEWKSRIV